MDSHRSEEFGLGATFKEEHPSGYQEERNAIEAVGGTRDHAAVGRLPSDRSIDVPAPTKRRAGPYWYPQTYNEYLDEVHERNWSHSQ